MRTHVSGLGFPRLSSSPSSSLPPPHSSLLLRLCLRPFRLLLLLLLLHLLVLILLLCFLSLLRLLLFLCLFLLFLVLLLPTLRLNAGRQGIGGATQSVDMPMRVHDHEPLLGNSRIPFGLLLDPLGELLERSWNPL